MQTAKLSSPFNPGSGSIGPTGCGPVARRGGFYIDSAANIVNRIAFSSEKLLQEHRITMIEGGAGSFPHQDWTARIAER
jgi:hypothetical protein